MPLWKNSDAAGSAPKFITNAATGETGTDEYGVEVIYVDGTEGYPVSTGWVRKVTVGSRTYWETLVAAKKRVFVSPLAAIMLIVDDPTTDTTPTITGYVENPGNSLGGWTVSLSINEGTAVEVTTAADGSFTYTVADALALGDYEVVATVVEFGIADSALFTVE